MTELVRWVDDHFEVDGQMVPVPEEADQSEVSKRLIGRTITEVGGFDDGYVLRLDDGQVVEFGVWCNDSTADTFVRFWDSE